MKPGREQQGCRGLALVVAILIGLLAGSVAAELRRVEAVGAYGIRDSARSRVIPRDEAIARARWEGVSRVARELIGESGTGFSGAPDGSPGANHSGPGIPGANPGDGSGSPGAGQQPALGEMSRGEIVALKSALGKDMLPYTRSYRILDDQGEQPVLFDDAPGVTSEYIVVVEVIVDVDRVNDALEQAGLVAADLSPRSEESVTLELVGLSRYEALEEVLSILREELGATRVQTLEFARERQILSVEGPFDAKRLSARLGKVRNPRLVLEPIGLDSESSRVRMLGRWFPDPGTVSAR